MYMGEFREGKGGQFAIGAVLCTVWKAQTLFGVPKDVFLLHRLYCVRNGLVLSNDLMRSKDNLSSLRLPIIGQNID
jgi:hypothetical protein